MQRKLQTTIQCIVLITVLIVGGFTVARSVNGKTDAAELPIRSNSETENSASNDSSGSQAVQPDAKEAAPARVAAHSARNLKYTVKPGDSLYSIARQFQVRGDLLKQANGLSGDLIYPGQILTIPSGNSGQSSGEQSLSQIIAEKGIAMYDAQLKIRVHKSDKILAVYAGNAWLKNYPIELGDNGMGDKQVSGDHKTPEGTFYITEISVLTPVDEYLGSRWMRLSYPNIEDAERGLSQNLINQWTHDQIVAAINQGQTPPQRTALGGGVGIHGGTTTAKGSNWTWGCIGLSDRDVEEIFPYVTVGTPVLIQH